MFDYGSCACCFWSLDTFSVFAVRDTDAESDRTITCSIILTASVVFSHRLVIAMIAFHMSFARHMFVVMIMSFSTCSIILTASVVFSHRSLIPNSHLLSFIRCARTSPSVPVIARLEKPAHSHLRPLAPTSALTLTHSVRWQYPAHSHIHISVRPPHRTSAPIFHSSPSHCLNNCMGP